MSRQSLLKSTLKALTVTMLVLLSGMVCIAQQQETEDLPNAMVFKDFEITIERTQKGLKMYSPKGSAWKELGFLLREGHTQAVDEYGMTKLDQVSVRKSADLADYLFTITMTKEGLTLAGMEGTAWTELKFKLAENGRKTINQFGIIQE